MNVSNSDHFKNFARPVLHGFYGTRTEASLNTLGIMDSAIQYIMNRSKLEVVLLKITEPTEDSFIISIESRISGTGPISSTVSLMEVDLAFNDSPVAKIKLPEFKTSFWGIKMQVPAQRIQLTDRTAYIAYVRSIIANDETTFRLDNGDCTVKAPAITATCKYNAETTIKGMAGPRMTLAKLEQREDEITMTLTMHNTSPVEVEHGMSFFELRNTNGELMAQLEGIFNVVRGDFDFTLKGKVKAGASLLSNKVSLIGVGVEGDSWCNETIRYIDAVVDVDAKFAELLKA